MPLTVKQLETVRGINKANAGFWRADREQFEQLRQKHQDDAHAHRLMEAARAIVDVYTQETGITSHAAAVRAAEAVEVVSRRIYAEGRQRVNTKSKALADKAALEKFHAWEKDNPRSVSRLDAAKLVKAYCETADISDREARRIRRLLREGKIFPCTAVKARS